VKSTGIWNAAGNFVRREARGADIDGGQIWHGPPVGRSSNPVRAIWGITATPPCTLTIGGSGVLLPTTEGRYVLLRYIVEKNNGTMSTTPRRSPTKFDVTIGNTTMTYRNLSFIEGHPVICNRILMADFGLTKNQSTHREGDKFQSEWDAAKAFGLAYNPESIIDNREIGANIYSSSDSFTFRQIRWGTANSVSIAWRNILYGTRIATVHTHGAYDANFNSDCFSRDDRDNARSRGVNSYVVTPLGELRLFNPNLNVSYDQAISIITSNMPFDLNHPSR
jgi:hypothetical protein